MFPKSALLVVLAAPLTSAFQAPVSLQGVLVVCVWSSQQSGAISSNQHERCAFWDHYELDKDQESHGGFYLSGQ